MNLLYIVVLDINLISSQIIMLNFNLFNRERSVR